MDKHSDREKLMRIIRMHKRYYVVSDGEREYLCRVSGNLRHKCQIKSEMPVVGDYVFIKINKDKKEATIIDIQPRVNSLYRKAANRNDIQVLAANIDTAFILTSLDNELSTGGISRYLTMVLACKIKPVIILTKTDLYEKSYVNESISGIKENFTSADIISVSVVSKEGFADIEKYITKGTTSVFIGASGAGKSSLVNAIIGTETQAVGDVRQYDDKGMHTTTHRELLTLSNGASVIDTPGLRSLGVWENENAVKETFSDLEQEAAKCRFHNCTHQHEPGCHIVEMLENDELSHERYRAYITLINETRYLGKENLLEIRKDKRKRLSKVIKQYKKIKK